jgi:hypothetical protein
VHRLQRRLLGAVPDRHTQLLRGLRRGHQHGLVWRALLLVSQASRRQSNHVHRWCL